jgi:hypothetical protein
MTNRHFHIPDQAPQPRRGAPLWLLALPPMALLAVTLGAAARVADGHPGTHGSSEQAVAQRLALHDGMRRLWEDHIIWTRMYLVGAIAGLPDTDATVERLLRNQADIGDAIRPYYGDAAGDQLTALLRDHILIAADVVTAAKVGDTARLTAEQARWQANADDIAALLSGANLQHWPREEIAAMMRIHLDTTTAEALARLRGDWAADVAAYDAVHTHILRMADMLSDGIIRQFPERFRSRPA